ncbi:MAG: dockerin type I repeat-containing protein [Clostridia bacterium]|nr:dockerin type I repeat-containing protein [Clostridia bacterium]
MKRHFLKHLSLLVTPVLLTTCVCASTITANTSVAVAADNETTTTTTAVACYATQLSYDRSPMVVGETRAIQFYHPVTKVARGGSVDTTSTNIAISYEDGSDTVYVTALAEGEAKLYIHENDCAFGAYAYLTIEAETTTTTVVPDYITQLSYDRSPMQVGETRAIQFYHPVTKIARGGSVDTTSTNIAISYEDGSDTVYVTALAEGEAKLYIRENDCAFGAYAYLTIEGVEVGCFPKGDVNQDGKLTTGDARLVLSYCLSGVMPLSDDWLSTADFDGNGKIETGDARSMLATTIDLI